MIDTVFACSTTKPKVVSQALLAILWKEQEDQYFSAIVDNNGIVIITEDCSSIEASVLLSSRMFNTFNFYKNEPFIFRANLSQLIKCVSLFSETASNMEIKATSETEIIIDIFDTFSTTTCKVRTHFSQKIEQNLSDSFKSANSPDVASFIVPSARIKELFVIPEASHRNSIPLTISINNNHVFEIKAEGSYGKVQSSVDLDQFKVMNAKYNMYEPFSASYHINSLLPAIKAMSTSLDTDFTFKGNGLLMIKQAFSKPNGGFVETAVEFIIAPVKEQD